MGKSNSRIGSSILLVVIFMLSSMTPALMATTTEAASARSSPDFSVTSMLLDGAGSVANGSNFIVEADTQVVLIRVTNQGSAAGMANLDLVHKGSPIAAETVVNSISLGSIASGTTTNVIQMSWNATLGDGQVLFARVNSVSDANSANNERRLDLDVKNYHAANDLSNNFPVPTGGQTVARLGYGTQYVNVSVVNEGVLPLSAVMSVVLTEVANPTNTMTLYSNTQILQAGSMLNPAVAHDLSVSFNSAGMNGVWTMTSDVTYNGTVYSSTETLNTTNVEFSDYISILSTPSDRTAQPGTTTTLTYVLRNIGVSSDSFSVSISSSLGWANTSCCGSNTQLLSPDAITTIQVPVTVPVTANRTEVDTVTLTLVSGGASFTLSGSARVMAGEFYRAEVTMPTGVTLVTPGQEVEVLVNIRNLGNVPSAFSLTSGLSVSASNWTYELSTETTSTVNENETVDVYMTVTVPPIQMPVDPTEHNRAGDVLQVWVSAQSMDGGIPNSASHQLEVRPVIVVDPGLETDVIDLTPEQVIQAGAGVGLDQILDLNVEIRHNLVTDLSETIDANLSVGDFQFTALNAGGFNEVDRWDASVSPGTITGLTLGEVELAALGIQGPADNYPLAGTLKIPITANPTLGTAHTNSGVISSAVTRNLTINIPTVLGAEIDEDGPLNASVGITNSYDIPFRNTGNDMTSYFLSIVDDLPDAWTVSLNTSTATSNVISQLASPVAQHPAQTTDHITSFTLNVITDPLTQAGTIVPVTVRVQEVDTGVFIQSKTIPIRVGEQVGATLDPTNQTVELSVTENPLTRVRIFNTGNTPTTYSVWLEDPEDDQVDFVMETPDRILVGPGFSESVKVRINPFVNASSDAVHMATLWVSTGTGLNMSANITANISESQSVVVQVNPDADQDSTTPGTQFAVIPGTTIDIPYTVANNGNLREDVEVNVSVEGGWEVSPDNTPFRLDIDEVDNDSVTVTVPALGGLENLANGEVRNVTFIVSDSDTGTALSTSVAQLVIAPVFDLEIVTWEDEYYFNRGMTRTISGTIENIGNRDVSVYANASILRAGLDVPSNDWRILSGSSQLLNLDLNEQVSFTLDIEFTEFEPDLSLIADLIVTIEPVDTDVTGSAMLESTLGLSRLFQETPAAIVPPESGGLIEETIVWSHIPIGAGTVANYEIELCGAVRGINPIEFNIPSENITWNFTLVAGDQEYELDLTSTCFSGSQGNESRIPLPARSPWVTNDPIQLMIRAPNTPNIISGDGYDLTFRLYHEDENNGYTQYTESTFTYDLAVYANPQVASVDYRQFEEGSAETVTVTVRNAGTALLVGATASITCPNADVVPIGELQGGVHRYPFLGPREEVEFEFEVTPHELDWWVSSESFNCTVTADAQYKLGDLEDDNTYPISDNVESASFDMFIVFGAFVGLFILSVILFSLKNQNEKFRVIGTYSGLACIGFAFHLVDMFWYGPAILLFALLWTWRMTWRVSEEFSVIHSDYQKKRQGYATLYTDHNRILKNSQSELSTIMSLPIFGFLVIVLGIPTQISTDTFNVVSLFAYVCILATGVFFIVRYANNEYGSLFFRMTQVELKAQRIELDLTDPAALLADIADEGIDLSSILGEAKDAVDEAKSDEAEVIENV